MNMRRRACALAVALLLFVAVGVAQDKKREAQLRTVRGVVADKSDSPLSGSVVFLKNVRTNSVRSSYTDDTGNCMPKKKAPSPRPARFPASTAARTSF